MGTTALLGRRGAGKTTFTCMYSAVANIFPWPITMPLEGAEEDEKNEIIRIVRDFVEEKLLPPETPSRIWNLTWIKKESFLTKKKIFYVDCAGDVQIEALKEIHDKIREGSGKDSLGEVLTEIFKKEGNDEFKKFVKNDILKKPFSISQSHALAEIKADIKAKVKIAFVKSILDSDRLIVLVDGAELRSHFEPDRTPEDLYDTLIYYSFIINAMRPFKVALVISKGHLFGVNKENYRDRLEEIRRDYIEKYPGTKQLLNAIRGANSHLKIFCVGVPSAGYKCKICGRSYERVTHAGKRPSCCDTPTREIYTDRSEIFGVEKVINWI